MFQVGDYVISNQAVTYEYISSNNAYKYARVEGVVLRIEADYKEMLVRLAPHVVASHPDIGFTHDEYEEGRYWWAYMPDFSVIPKIPHTLKDMDRYIQRKLNHAEI